MKTHSADGHVKKEARTGVMLPEAKEHLGSPKTGRGKATFFPRGLREHDPANTLILDL